MAFITRNDVCQCDVCGHEWLREKNEKIPARCPSRKCRSSLWNAADVQRAGGNVVLETAEGVIGMS